MEKNRREGKKSREEWKASVGTNSRSSGTEKERDDDEKAERTREDERGRERTREDQRRERKERNEDVDPRTHRRTNVGFVKLDGIVAVAVERPQTTAPPSTSCGRPSLK